MNRENEIKLNDSLEDGALYKLASKSRMFRMILYRLFPPLRKHLLLSKEKRKYKGQAFFNLLSAE